MSIEAEKHIREWLDNEDPKASGGSRTVTSCDGYRVRRLFWDGNVIYSFGKHFELARKILIGGQWAVFVNPERSRSKTTARHIDDVQRQASRRAYVLGVLHPTLFASLTQTDTFTIHSSLIGDAFRKGCEYAEELRTAREQEKRDQDRNRREVARGKKRRDALKDKAWVRETLNLLRGSDSDTIDSLIHRISEQAPKQYRETVRLLQATSLLIIEQNNAKVKNFGVLGAGRSLASAQVST